MRPVFDATLQWSWEELSSKGVSREAWLSSGRKLLCMFADAKDIEAIECCQGDYSSVCGEVGRVVGSSVTGQSVYKSACLRA